MITPLPGGGGGGGGGNVKVLQPTETPHMP